MSCQKTFCISLTIASCSAADVDRVGRYVDAERIASGSQATVYRALDPGLGRTVAIKVIIRIW